MEDAKQHIEDSDVIFLHAPGLNKLSFMTQSKPLSKFGHKVRSIEFKSNKANSSEAKELVAKIIEVNI